MSRIVFLLEERSMAEALRGLLPRVFPKWRENQDWIVIVHEGKSDLEGAIPRKLRAWKVPGDRFLIVRDNDGGDCVELKSRLLALAQEREAGEVLVRIVCQELEGWFLGDPKALREAYPHVASLKIHSIPDDPDAMTNASEFLARITGQTGKILAAKAIAPHLDPARNKSRSFHVFLEGIKKLSLP